MSTQQLKVIALALAAVLLLWAGSELFSRGSDTITGNLALPALVPGDVDTITLIKGTDSIVVAKASASVWTVNGHRAAPDAVGTLVAALKDTTRPELVAEDASSFARLNVDSATGRWLRVTGGGKPPLRLIFGARGSEFSSAYVRRPGDRHVFLWRGRLATLVDRTLDDWRDKRIAAVPPDSVAQVEVERGRDRYVLQRRGATWTLGSAAADSGAVARLLEKYRTVTGAGFASRAQADSASGRRPTRRVTLRDVHSALLVSLVFDSIPGGFWVRRTGGRVAGGEAGAVYRMNAWDVDGLTPASRSLAAVKK
jgi:hypothetical protein